MDVPECMNPSCAENRKLLPLLFYLSIFHWSISQVHPHRVYRQKMRVSGERSIPPRITTDSGSMDIPVTFSCAKNRKLILPWSILRVHPHHFYRQEMRSDWEKQKKKTEEILSWLDPTRCDCHRVSARVLLSMYRIQWSLQILASFKPVKEGENFPRGD